jgi:uncharacterized protein (TIGR00255 family)
MTGFGRASAAHGATSWHWEARSVNNRGLDVRLRLPPGYDALEPKARELAQKRFTRGSLNISLSIERATAPAKVSLNEEVLRQVMAAAQRLHHLADVAPARADGLLGLKGVLEVIEAAEDETEVAARHGAILASLDEALAALAGARAGEGLRLAQILGASVGEVARLTAVVAASPARTPQAIAARLNEQVGRLIETGQGLDPARLHQEAVIIATRADVEEELKRLQAHVESARELLAAGGAVGRKLDFLAQEFNREANTLTSKANDTDIARAGLAMKVVIDQMREQVQNIE